jgi:hypothetical protein
MPYGPGSEVGCKRMPAFLGKFIRRESEELRYGMNHEAPSVKDRCWSATHKSK